jgi:hypothetical protein
MKTISNCILITFLLSCLGASPTPCPKEGDDRNPFIQSLNLLKNRVGTPTLINGGITLAAMLAPGNDETRFDSDFGAKITGYVFDVKPGGIESCNCHATDEMHRDTHIEIVAQLPNSTDIQVLPVIVEITPAFKALHPDWTTPNIKKKFLHQKVTVTGWMLADVEHAGNSFNTNPTGSHLWRDTIWELHPVTDIQLAK